MAAVASQHPAPSGSNEIQTTKKWGRARRSDLARRLARLNHILVPDTAAERDRLRQTKTVKLLGVTAAVFLGFSREGRVLWFLSIPIGLASLNLRFSQVHLIFAMIVGLLLGSWLVRPLFALPKIRSRVRAPQRVAAGNTASFEIEVHNAGDRAIQNLELVQPFLPWDGKWVGRPEGVAHLEPGKRCTLIAQASFQARGEHHLDKFQFGQVVPLGLGMGTLKSSEDARFLVVPKVANVVSLEPLAAGAPQGLSHLPSERSGENEFGGVRPYRQGDPLKHLHARTWARTGEPHVREFLQEQNERVALVVLVEAEGRSAEASLSLAAGIASRLALHGAGLDALICGQHEVAVTPRSGPGALDSVLDRLATCETAPVTDDSLQMVELYLKRATRSYLVTSGAPHRYRDIVDRARKSGGAIQWCVVHDEDTAVAPSQDYSSFEAEKIDEGVALSC